jgi:hypothetical protein
LDGYISAPPTIGSLAKATMVQIEREARERDNNLII